MRKFFVIISALFITGSLFAGGLVTNSNQSAAWVRLPSRNASTSIDAAYFNPAGLMKLENGFHISLSNQSIWQNRTVKNDYAGPGGAYGLNNHTFEGTVTAPLFPSVSVVYKMDKLAFNLGFYPVGGGGGALFEQGLPSFEMSASDLVPSLAASAGVTGYRLDAHFKGNSIFLGYQGGVSYKINDIISVAFGLRLVRADNSYTGYLRDIQLNIAGAWVPAGTVLTGLAAKLTSITTIPASLAPAISGGAGGFTLAQMVAANQLPAATKTSIETALAAIGVPAANIPVMTVSQISGTITAATPTINGQIATATATSTLVADQTADAEQTGSGITPVFSVNISPSEYLNIGIKYEMATKLDLTNKTAQDFKLGYTSTGQLITMFPNGAKTRNDMPAMLSFGMDYILCESLKLSLGSNYYFDKSSDYGHKIDEDLNSSTPTTHISNKDIIANNGISLHGGLECNISKNMLLSGGYIWSNKGVNSRYQSDLTHGLATQTFGIGGAYSFSDKVQLNLGASYTAYKKDMKVVDHIFSGTGANITSNESYEKETFIVAVGLDFNF